MAEALSRSLIASVTANFIGPGVSCLSRMVLSGVGHLKHFSVL